MYYIARVLLILAVFSTNGVIILMDYCKSDFPCGFWESKCIKCPQPLNDILFPCKIPTPYSQGCTALCYSLWVCVDSWGTLIIPCWYLFNKQWLSCHKTCNYYFAHSLLRTPKYWERLHKRLSKWKKNEIRKTGYVKDMMSWYKLWTYLLFIWILQATPLRNTLWFSASPLGRLSHKGHLRYFIIKPREVEKCLNFHIVSIIDITSFLKNDIFITWKFHTSIQCTLIESIYNYFLPLPLCPHPIFLPVSCPLYYFLVFNRPGSVWMLDTHECVAIHWDAICQCPFLKRKWTIFQQSWTANNLSAKGEGWDKRAPPWPLLMLGIFNFHYIAFFVCLSFDF